VHLIHTIEALKTILKGKASTSTKIGFVPTMGALHEGHLSLIKQAKEECDLVVCSIFVNPTQFNNPADLIKYPRTEEKDVELLQSIDCDIVFIPDVKEIYPYYPNQTTFIEINLSPLDEVMEGSSRPGHFNGVANIVYRLFDIVKPNKAYFGQKDFQQVSILHYMVKELKLPIELVVMPTFREKSGLAMSSRNMRLSEKQSQDAVIIFQTLQFGKSISSEFSPQEVKNKMIAFFEKGNLTLDYLEIVHPETLSSLEEKWVFGAVACIAAFCGEVRLIDNMPLFV
jgi:pantoate--beta-alanine ligase